MNATLPPQADEDAHHPDKEKNMDATLPPQADEGARRPDKEKDMNATLIKIWRI